MSASVRGERKQHSILQPQRGDMFIAAEQQKILSSVRSGMGTGHAAPMGLFFILQSFTINMPLLTELALRRLVIFTAALPQFAFD